MIDLSNAFNENNNDVMIDKLITSSLPKIIIRTMGYMLKNTEKKHFNNGKGEKLENK